MSLIDCDHRTPLAADAGYPYIAIPQIKEGRLDLSGVRRISPEHFAEWTRKAKPQHHDVILSRRCNPGETAYVPAGLECALGQNLVLLRSDGKKIFPPFLRWLLHGPDWWEQVGKFINVGAIFNSLKCADIPLFKMRLPPLAEQKAIAAVLGALDDKIELNRRMNATLEAMARALFQSWFVDFDPVRVKLDGRPPAALDPATSALFPAHFQESPLGHIPQGWRVDSVYEIADVIYGAPFASALFNAHKIGKPLVRIRDLYDENPAIFTTETLTKGYLLKPGDIAVGMDGEFRAHLWGGVESWLNQRVCVFAPKHGYSAAFVRNSIFALLAQVEATETATTVIHLGKNEIDRFNVNVPDGQVVNAFNQVCQPWYDRIVANKQQSRTLATLRNTLLPKLLSGELSVNELNPNQVAAP
ncbi:MAG: restriction endonuclease subunit S [Rhodoferax sp.]|nr:restriction endonuclease subunit S [Rhodoferax sp.]